jgi:hypothetical protein
MTLFSTSEKTPLVNWNNNFECNNRSGWVDDYSDIFGDKKENKCTTLFDNRAFNQPVNHSNPLPMTKKRTRSIPEAAVSSVKKQCMEKSAPKAVQVSQKTEHTVGNVTFKIKSKPCHVGSNCYIYEIAPNQPRLFPTHANNQLYFKCFKPEIFAKDPSAFESYFENMIAQHRQLKDSKFPVVDILNAETAVNDGFLIVEKISESFKMTFDAVTKIEELSEYEKNLLDQVKAAFAFAYDNRIGLDYRKSNVGVKNGQVVLYDLMEKLAKIELFIENAVLSFSKNRYDECNLEIYDYLMPQNVPLQFIPTRARFLQNNMIT